MSSEIKKIFGDKVRVRACGLCWEGDSLLVINHRGLNSQNRWWAPPGGGIDYGSTVEETLIHEFKEETGLNVGIGSFLFACEFIRKPLHAIELFFDVKIMDGHLKAGFDPELQAQQQIIMEARFMPFSEIISMPADERHGLFALFNSEKGLKEADGYWKI